MLLKCSHFRPWSRLQLVAYGGAVSADLDYYRRRLEAERDLAHSAGDADMAALHEELASLYERMGFRRAPEIDFRPAPGVLVKGYRLAL